MRKSLTLFSIIFLTISLFGQKTNQTTTEDSISTKKVDVSRLKLLAYDGKAALGSVLNGFAQPVRWDGEDLLILGGVAASTAILYIFDDDTQRFFNNQKNDIPKEVLDFGFRLGKPLFNYGLTTGIYVTGLVTKNEKIRKTGVLLISSATVGGLIQSVVKTLAGRARPDTGRGRDELRFYDTRAGFHSLPSGHTVLSVTLAHAIAKQFKNPFVKGGIYAIGAVSPISRMWLGAHWLTDVFLGAALSIAVVEGVDHYMKRKELYGYDKKTASIQWNLSVGAGSIGITGRF